MNQKYLNSLWLAFAAAIISGTANFANGYVVKGIDPLLVNVVKNGLVGIAVITLVILTGKWRQIKQLRRKDLLKLGLIAGIGGSLPFYLYFAGLRQIGAIEDSLIHKTLVFWVALIAVPLLKEKFTWNMAAGILLLYASNLVVGFSGFKHIGIGHVMVLVATIMWAVENSIAKRALAHIDTDIVVASRMGGGAIILFMMLAAEGKTDLLFTLSSQQLLLLAGVAALLLGYVMTWYRALKVLPATYVSSILVSATIVTTVLQTGLVNHHFSPLLMIQAIFIVAGICLVTLIPLKRYETDTYRSVNLRSIRLRS